MARVHMTRHRSSDYESLAYMVGGQVEVEGLHLYAEPEEIRILNDYKNTVLLEMKFGEEKPRYVRQMIMKCDLATGHIKMRSMYGDPLWGDAISKWKYEVTY